MRTRQRSFRAIAAVAVTGLLFGQLVPLPAFAQGAPPPQPGAPDQQGGDPPARVGRLAHISGTVSFHTQDETQWSPAVANYPVTTGNAFWTQPNSQVDIEVSASRVVMAPTTEIDITTLSDTAFQASEPQGEAYLRLRTALPNETYAMQTPRGLVTFAVPGRYEVAAGDTQSPTLVTVIDGTAQVADAGSNLSLQVGPNQTATINGTDTFTGSVGPAQRDAFLTAMLARDQPPAAPQAAPPPLVAAMPGGEDLAEYGTWSQSPEYGQIWYPQVAAGWVPYREGHWAYVAPWGWTWVDDAPWGFAPFHYGRWVNYGGRWGWTPGVVAVGVVEPVYAPALVTFFGLGVGIGIGAVLAGGNVGWLPLGWGEAYQPWYRASTRYVRSVNVTNVTNVANITTINRNVTINNYANAGAATVAPAAALTTSRPVAQVAQRVTSMQLAQAHPVIGQQPVLPTAATAGVTPAVAKQLRLPAAPQAARLAAPGPAIRPVVTGTAAAAAAAAAAKPPLHNPGAVTVPGAPAGAAPVAAGVAHPPATGAAPAAAGTVGPSLTTPGRGAPGTPPPIAGGAPGPAITPHLGTATPALRAPAVGGQAGANPAGTTGVPMAHPTGVTTPGTVPNTGAQVRLPTPSSVPPVPPATPAVAPPPAAGTVHVPPPTAPTPPAGPVVYPAPTVVHPPPQPPPAVVHPPPQPPPAVVHPPPQPAPTVVHPPPQPAPAVVHSPPQPAPAVVHQPPPPPPPQPHPAPNKQPGQS